MIPADSVAVLREAGARFAYLHGSRAAGTQRPGSDIDELPRIMRSHREFAASVIRRRG